MSHHGYQEVVVSTDLRATTANCVVWEPMNGKIITTFRGGNSAPHGLCRIGQDHLLSVSVGEPILRVWTWSPKNRVERKMTVPGVVTAMAVSPQSHYAVAAIKGKLYVWHVSSGLLKTVLNAHFEDVNCIKFTERGGYFISGGKDGIVLAWKLSNVLHGGQHAYEEKHKPLYRWSDHRAEINDIYVGFGELKSRVASVACDKSCRIYSLQTGDLCFTVLMNIIPRCVLLDPAEYFLIIGLDNGSIFQFPFYECWQKESVTLKEIEKASFPAHRHGVTCLSSSADGKLYLSGGEDFRVCVWDTLSKTRLAMHSHSGPITNAFFTYAPYSLRCTEKVEPDMVVQTFKRSLDQQREDYVKVKLPTLQSTPPRFTNVDDDDAVLKVFSVKGACEGPALGKAEVQKQLSEVQHINEQLYSFMTSSFFSGIKSTFMTEQEGNQ